MFLYDVEIRFCRDTSKDRHGRLDIVVHARSIKGRRHALVRYTLIRLLKALIRISVLKILAPYTPTSFDRQMILQIDQLVPRTQATTSIHIKAFDVECKRRGEMVKALYGLGPWIDNKLGLLHHFLAPGTRSVSLVIGSPVQTIGTIGT